MLPRPATASDVAAGEELGNSPRAVDIADAYSMSDGSSTQGRRETRAGKGRWRPRDRQGWLAIEETGEREIFSEKVQRESKAALFNMYEWASRNNLCINGNAPTNSIRVGTASLGRDVAR